LVHEASKAWDFTCNWNAGKICPVRKAVLAMFWKRRGRRGLDADLSIQHIPIAVC